MTQAATCSPRTRAAFAALVRDATVVTIPHSGHTVQGDNPARLLAAIRRVPDRHRPEVASRHAPPAPAAVALLPGHRASCRAARVAGLARLRPARRARTARSHRRVTDVLEEPSHPAVSCMASPWLRASIAWAMSV